MPLFRVDATFAVTAKDEEQVKEFLKSLQLPKKFKSKNYDAFVVEFDKIQEVDTD